MGNREDKRLHQLNTLIEMTSLINSTLDPSVLRKKAVEAVTRLLDAEAGSLLLIDQKTEDLFFEVAVGEKGGEVKSIRLKKGVGIAGWVAGHNKPVLINDVASDQRFFADIDEKTGFHTKNMACVPVKSKDRMLGVLQAINHSAGSFAYDDMIILHALANQVAIAIENAQLYQESITDGLTGLYHHKYFELRLKDELDRARRHRLPLTLAMLDIDFFKNVNDTWGHTTGDMVIEKVATILKEKTRLSDVVARYGGEEFAVILPQIPYSNALQLGERFRKSIEEYDFNGLKITISIGIGYYAGADLDVNYKKLIELADSALYAAKNNGRNRVESIFPE
jgi:diguanylate cyclase (GGDEF)-like protein